MLILGGAIFTAAIGAIILMKAGKKGPRKLDPKEPENDVLEPNGTATQKTIKQASEKKMVFPLQKGVYNNELVKELQLALGFKEKGIDGDWGKTTQLAMEKSGLPKEHFVIKDKAQFDKVIKMLNSSVSLEEVIAVKNKLASSLKSQFDSKKGKLVAIKDNWGQVVNEGKTAFGNQTWSNTGRTIEISSGDSSLVPYSFGTVSGTLIVKMQEGSVFDALTGKPKFVLVKVDPRAYVVK